MAALYTIVGEYREAFAKLEAMEDLDNDTIRDTLESISGPLEGKVLAYGAFIRNLEVEAANCKAAADGMVKRAKARQGTADHLRAALLAAMSATGTDKVKGDQFDVAIKSNPPALTITDEAKLKFAPAHLGIYKTVPEVPEHDELDNAALKAALVAGNVIAGAELKRGKRVEIK
jgi:hypothetical protein